MFVHTFEEKPTTFGPAPLEKNGAKIVKKLVEGDAALLRPDKEKLLSEMEAISTGDSDLKPTSVPTRSLPPF